MTPLESLKKIGVEQICSDTHIASANLELLLSEEFSSFSYAQFRGFLSILEREYGLNLDEWRDKYDGNRQESTETISNDPFANSVQHKKSEQKLVFILAAALITVVIVAGVAFTQFSSKEKMEINNTAINIAKRNIETVELEKSMKQDALVRESESRRFDEIKSEKNLQIVTDENRTEEVVDSEDEQSIQNTDSASSAAQELETPDKPAINLLDNIIIHPRTKMWIGMIDAKTLKRETKATRKPIRLDGTKEWLIITGHGQFDLECGEERERFAGSKGVMILYGYGVCDVITESEFRAKNRGRLW